MKCRELLKFPKCLLFINLFKKKTFGDYLEQEGLLVQDDNALKRVYTLKGENLTFTELIEGELKKSTERLEDYMRCNNAR